MAEKLSATVNPKNQPISKFIFAAPLKGATGKHLRGIRNSGRQEMIKLRRESPEKIRYSTKSTGGSHPLRPQTVKTYNAPKCRRRLAATPIRPNPANNMP